MGNSNEICELKNKPRLIQQGHNSMCYIVKLQNDEFIIFDSGNNRAEGGIYDTLMSESDDGHPVIAAWFFPQKVPSHPILKRRLPRSSTRSAFPLTSKDISICAPPFS